MRLKEPLIQQGFWWLPDTPDKKLPGRLVIAETGHVSLEMLGLFEDNVPVPRADVGRILGVLENGKFTTLDRCFYADYKVSFGGLSTGTVNANIALLGAHFDVSEALRFSQATFSCEGLDEWLGISGISLAHDWEANTTTINYKLPQCRTYRVKDKFELSPYITALLPVGSKASEIKITQTSAFRLDFIEPQELDDILTHIHRLTNFLCLAFDQPTSLTLLAVSSADIVQQIGDKTTRVQIDIYYPSLPNSDKSPRIDPYSNLFSYSAVADELDYVLANWLEQYDQLEPAFSSYFAATTAKYPYVEEKFLTLVQGLENLHRRCSDKTAMPEEEFSEIKANLLASCPSNRREWLKGRLAYANEITLRQRLKELPVPFTEYIGNGDMVEKLINDVVTARNYFTHYDRSLEAKTKFGLDLALLCRRLEVLFELLLLKQLGFTDEKIKGILATNPSLLKKLRAQTEAHS